MKDCELWNPNYDGKDFHLKQECNPGWQDQQASV